GILTYSPKPNCPVPATINFSASGGTSYSWTWKSGGSSTSSTPNKTYLTAPFKDTATVIVQNIYGCIDSVWDSVIIHNIRILVLGANRGCAPLTYTPVVHLLDDAVINGTYPYPNPAALYWDFGDGDTSTAIYPIHVYTTAGTYRRIVKITTTNGCVVWDTGYVHVGNLYHPSFVINPDTVCVNVPIFFQNTSSKQHSNTLFYSWDLGVAYFSVDSQNAILAYSTPGIYTIKLYADSNGCVDSSMCANCLVVLPPNASFSDSIFCPPNEHMVQFRNGSIGATSNLWRFGDGSTSTLTNPQHTYPSYGNYTAQLITDNNIYGCSDTMNWPVKISNFGIDFQAVDTTLCKDDVLQLTPISSGTTTLTLLVWSVDNLSVLIDTPLKGVNYVMKPWATGTLNGLKTPVVGSHDVQLIAMFQNFGQHVCYDTIVKRNYFIVSHPSPKFSASPLVGCTPLTATFIDSTIWTPRTQGSYLLWRFGDGDTLRNLATSITHTYIKSGLFNPKLIARDWNGCIDSFNFPSLIESRKPKAVFGLPSLRSCIGKTIAFSDSSQSTTMLSYAWTFGDGDSSMSNNPSHAYKAIGAYPVRLIVADITGCRDTMTKIIRVTQPKASFTLSDTFGICPPLVVSFVSTSTGAFQYAWDFKNSGSASIANPTSTFYNPGIYNVRLIITDSGGCADTASRQVRVLGYAGAFDYPATSGCAPLTVSFTCKISGVADITWDFADGTTQKGIGLTSSHTYLHPGAYVPKLIFSDDSIGCKSSSIGLDTIKVDGVIAGFKALPPCEKTPILLVDTSFSYFSPIKYSRWDFGAAGQALGNPIS
ncbi:MAG: PKD domain-containing protein, partial [Chitinophagaceae bacterium]